MLPSPARQAWKAHVGLLLETKLEQPLVEGSGSPQTPYRSLGGSPCLSFAFPL